MTFPKKVDNLSPFRNVQHSSGITKGMQKGEVAPGCNRLGGTKQPRQKISYDYFNDHKSELDKFGR